ncbi:histidine biosynthesis bifunctional protein hisIE, chloroplastic-like [Pyrus communis]|uniref:histidine biosynthesis bifunctional protein hisIE, chloroplastic-like n=1 Tax=Pyrus communis TaxID=23211 RepID=UPI0035BF0CF3
MTLRVWQCRRSLSLIAMMNCVVTNLELEIRERHDFETHSKRQKDLTGNHERISCMTSGGREEADELCRTLEENEDRLRAASEMADVLYHGMALLGRKSVKMEEVLEILRRRFSQSSIEEKRNRKSQA